MRQASHIVLRKKPTQERSKLRVKRILDTAALVFAEVGYAAATVETIAERAGVSIGSLYQFFPNKRALFNAVGAAYLEESRGLFDRLMTPERLAQPWDTAARRAARRVLPLPSNVARVPRGVGDALAEQPRPPTAVRQGARSTVECAFNLLKQARRFATRYEKTLRNYAAVVAIGCALLWLRL